MIAVLRRCAVLAVAFALCLIQPVIASADDKIAPLDSRALTRIVENDGKGKVVLVNIFASWCPPCQKEIPVLKELRAEFPEKQVLFIGVSMDHDMDALRAFMDEHKFNFPVYLASGDFSEAYGVQLIPQLLMFDKSGELLVNYNGLAEKKELEEAINVLLANKAPKSN